MSFRMDSVPEYKGGEFMNEQGGLYDDLEKIVAKLCVLRDSCTGVLHTDKSDSGSMWFQGAEAMLQEAVDKLQRILRGIEKGSE